MTSSPASKARFHWDDPFLLDEQLSDDERMVRDAASAYCQDRLAPRVIQAFRNHTTAQADLALDDRHRQALGALVEHEAVDLSLVVLGPDVSRDAELV